MTQRGRATRPTGRPRGAAGPRGGDLAARRDRLRAVIEPVVNDAGYDLEDLSVSRAGRRHVVRVMVDTDGGIDLDAVADVSRAVSAALDAAEETGGDIVAGEYQLEVSSPGVDRPLTLPRHWRRNVGRLVKVTARGAAALPGQRGEQPAGDRQLTGRVVAADDEGVHLETDDGRAAWAYAQLGPGRVQVEFTRLAELGEPDDEFDDADDSDEIDDDSDDIDDEDDVEDEER
ncbi:MULTISPECIES: ribosome maturation factor RimP [Micromonospora]|uniref:Ribosome maturation factor RimP n=2 Tax=Micromonospora TaxID=1873 RepID=A0A328MXR3_9ACTN|nr:MULTISPECIES: ribosome maturation factor RimP [Micromonospora]KAB1923604.1 ribosome maturation factor RimP [Micromonospora noduli]RAN92368.1 Ribosome maturation factor RimP [Micromonospora saelicesensis]RAN96908.1 Ribosome maturation factor RimP [Micromonospora noduli]RAO18238.1 Ribosome maturation factor RimP [Micromonospora noduli]RAO18276.1 Ribosome maturation factor RimP [Micromonospora noduli]